MKSLDKIVNSIKEFPTLPTIFGQLSDAMTDPDTNINYVANIIEKDTASVTKLLKLANSSIFGFRNRVTTVPQAILYLGFEEVKNLLLSLKVIQIFRTKEKNIKLITPLDFWTHSVSSGVIARIIASSVGIRSSETLFLGGVMHNIGRLLFYITLPDEYSEVLKLQKVEKISISDAERKVIGISSSLAGEMLAQKWKLPLPIIDIIKYHNTGTISDKINLNVAIIHIADLTASMFELGSDGREYIAAPNPQVWDNLKLPVNFFSTNYNRIIAETSEHCNVFLSN